MKLLIKALLIISIFFSDNVVLISQRPVMGDYIGVNDLPTHDGSHVEGCYIARFEGVKDYYCVGEPIDISIVVEWDPSCTGATFCKYRVGFFIDNLSTFITDEDLDSKTDNQTIYKFNKKLDKGNHKLTFSLVKSCGSADAVKLYEEVNVNIREEGDRYEVTSIYSEVHSEHDCDYWISNRAWRNKTSVCCGEKGVISVEFSVEESNSNSNTYTISGGANFGLSGGFFSFKDIAGFNTSFTVSDTYTEGIVNSLTKSFSCDNPKGSIVPGIKVRYNKYIVEEFIADCNDSTIDERSEKTPYFFLVPFGLLKYKCNGI